MTEEKTLKIQLEETLKAFKEGKMLTYVKGCLHK